MKVRGKGKKGILIVLDSPEKRDDAFGKPYRDNIGKLVKQKLAYYGLDVFEDCWTTYSIICYPNAKYPTSEQVRYCRPNVLTAIKRLNPESILLIGDSAIRSVISEAWGDSVKDMASNFYGQQIPFQDWNCWILPIISPHLVFDNSEKEGWKRNPVIDRMFDSQMDAAVSRIGDRPWSSVPDYKSQVEILTDPKEVLSVLKKEIPKSEFSAFDYETNMLKPDSKKSEMFSNSICFDGNRTIAYPLLPALMKPTRAYLRSESKKIASNLKFEARWSMQFFKTRVRNWYWDTMLSAHVLERKNGSSSIKFQAFVCLGFPLWNKHIEPLLKSDERGGYNVNRISSISMEDLLLYNGLDSLVEYLVAEKQIERYNSICKLTH